MSARSRNLRPPTSDSAVAAPSSSTVTIATAPTSVPWIDRPKRSVFIAASTVLIAVVVLFFFTPRFVWFAGLDLPEAWRNPEINRAVDTFRQINDPFTPIANPTNRVISWRLLFPMIAYYLHMPRVVYLAIPPLGCLIVIAIVLNALLRYTGNRTAAVAGTVLFASTSWFFVSTGWLTYFDSWYMLGLCVVAFVRSRITLIVVCATMPWVDERFILSLPLCALLRGIYFSQLLPRPTRRWLLDMALVVGVASTYLIVRLITLMSGNDPTSGMHLEEAAAHSRSVLRMLEGWWYGLRLLWVGVVMCLWLSCSRKNPLWSALLITTTVLTMGVNTFIANDLSRSVSALVPVGVMGIMAMWRRRPGAQMTNVLIALALGNLLLPARHVITLFTVPIRYLYTEIDNYEQPPAELRPEFYIQRGGLLYQHKQLDAAIRDFTTAIKLNPLLSTAYNNRGVAHAAKNELAEAENDYEAALAIDPKLADGYLNRGQLRANRNDNLGAFEDFKKALEFAPPDWPSRGLTEQLRTRYQPFKP